MLARAAAVGLAGELFVFVLVLSPASRRALGALSLSKRQAGSSMAGRQASDLGSTPTTRDLTRLLDSICARLPQQFGDFRVALFFCNPTWGPALRLNIGVRTFPQQ